MSFLNKEGKRMYPIEMSELMNSNLSFKQKILFLSNINFEIRSISAARYLNQHCSQDIIWSFFQIAGYGSQYEEKCNEYQKIHYNEIISEINLNLINEKKIIRLIDPLIRPDEDLILYYKDLIARNPGVQTIIFDITAIPKVCYIPFLNWLLNGNLRGSDFFIVYTKPKSYGKSELASEPYPPKLIIGEPLGKRDLIWIPSLGFKSEFTKKCWDYINNLRNLNKEINIRIYPLLGFPAFKPDYFDKSLLLHHKTFSSIPDFRNSLKNQAIYATADDPYDVYHKVSKIANNNKEKDIVLSPVGSKPMSIGIALAGIFLGLRIILIQAKTYHPDYSEGTGEISVYWLKRDDKYTF